MKKHILTIHEGYKKNCEDCGIICTSKQKLKKHTILVHGKGETHKCPLCVKSFLYPRELEKHVKQFHEGQTDYKKYKCESCGKLFSYPHGLKNHIHTIHEGHKDFKCELCGKALSTAQNLRFHVSNVHEEKKKFNCNYCGKIYSDLSKRNYQCYPS